MAIFYNVNVRLMVYRRISNKIQGQNFIPDAKPLFYTDTVF